MAAWTSICNGSPQRFCVRFRRLTPEGLGTDEPCAHGSRFPFVPLPPFREDVESLAQFCGNFKTSYWFPAKSTAPAQASRAAEPKLGRLGEGDAARLGGGEGGGEDELDECGEQGGHGARLAGGGLAADLGENRADQAALGRLRKGSGRGRKLAALAQVGVEALDLLLVAPPDRRPGDEGLGQEQPGERWLGGEELEPGGERGAHPQRPVLLGAVGGGEALAEQLGGGLEGGEVAGFDGVEVLVEGAGGDAGAFGDVGDRGAVVAELGDGADQRGEEALALVALDELGWQPVAAVRQPRQDVGLLRPLSGRVARHGANVIGFGRPFGLRIWCSVAGPG